MRRLSAKTARPVGTKANPVMLGASSYGRPYDPAWPLERIVRDAFLGSVWVYRGVNAIATNAAMLQVVSRKGNRQYGETVDTPIARLLNGQPNSYEAAFPFRWRVAALLILNKQGVFINVERTNGGAPDALHILPPTQTKVIPHRADVIAGYEVKTSGADPIRFGPDDVVWMKQPNPLTFYEGTTALEPAGLTIDMDAQARSYNRNFLANDGRPAGLVGVAGDMDGDVRRELQTRLRGTPGKAGEVQVISMDKMEWIDLMKNPRDLQWNEGRKQARDEILASIGVPPSKVGNASESTFANADAEDRFFWQETMRGHLALQASGWDSLDLQSDTFTGFDTSDIYALADAGAELRKAHMSEVAGGTRTIDEYRAEWGMEPFGDEVSTSLWIPLTGATQLTKAGERAFLQVKGDEMRMVTVNGKSPAEEWADEVSPVVLEASERQLVSAFAG